MTCLSPINAIRETVSPWKKSEEKRRRKSALSQERQKKYHTQQHAFCKREVRVVLKLTSDKTKHRFKPHVWLFDLKWMKNYDKQEQYYKKKAIRFINIFSSSNIISVSHETRQSIGKDLASDEMTSSVCQSALFLRVCGADTQRHSPPQRCAPHSPPNTRTVSGERRVHKSSKLEEDVGGKRIKKGNVQKMFVHKGTSEASMSYPSD